MKNAFKHIMWFIKQEKKKYILCFFLLIIVSIFPLIPAKYLGVAIDAISNGTLTKEKLIFYVSSLLLWPLTVYLCNVLYHYLFNLLGHILSFQLREKYIAHLFDLDANIYEKYTKGDLIARATNDLETLKILATSFLQEIIFNTAMIIASIVMMITIHPLLTLESTIFMPFLILILNRIRRKKRQHYKRHREIYSEMTESVLESIEGVKTVRAYGQEENDFKHTKISIDNDINSWWRILKFEAIFPPLFELIYALAYFIAIAMGCYYVMHGQMSAGSLVTFLVYVAMLYSPLISIAGVLNQINSIIMADERLQEILDAQPIVKDVENPLPVMTFEKIEFKDVSFRYPFDNFDVIKDISFEIHNGQTIGIVGPTGGGKSTIIRQLLREFNVTEGKILIDDRDIQEYKIEDIHNMVGYVPQDHILFRRTVDDNILLGNPKAGMKDLQRAMYVADFKKDLAYLPEGEKTMVQELGSSLSGGQKQRLSIARAVIRDPEILILDDSLSAVDALTESTIISHLKETRKGKTNIIVAHRFSAIAQSDIIFVLQNGQITDRGTHEELLKYDNWYKFQYLNQIKESNHEEKY